MFRLFLIISVFMISSCSNTRPTKKEAMISSSLREQQNMKSMILVVDFGDSECQIIKCCDSVLTYGVGYVETANKTISESDVAWNSSYPIIRKKLGVAQQKTMQVAISKLDIHPILIPLLLRIMLNTPYTLTTVKLLLDIRLAWIISP